MVTIKTSMLLDAICYLEQRFLNNQQWMPKQQVETIRSLNAVYAPLLRPEYLGMSTFSLIVGLYTDNRSLDKVTLNDAIHLLRHMEQLDIVVRSKIPPGSVTASYVLPMLDWLKEFFAGLYIHYFSVLKANGFESFWETSCFPAIQRQIQKRQAELDAADLHALFGHIASMKNQPILENYYIYISYFSAPTVFSLWENGFVDHCGQVLPLVRLLAHEQMHEAISLDCIRLYHRYIAQSPYLTACNQSFRTVWGGEDEEELVLAAEYYLAYAMGKPKAELLSEAIGTYGECCPAALLVFDALTRENSVPTDYNTWLIRLFTNDHLPIIRSKKDLADLIQQ